MIPAAAEAGLDAVKFQNFKTEDFIFDRTLTFTYKNQGKAVTESMCDLCKRCAVLPGWLPILKKHVMITMLFFFQLQLQIQELMS